MQERELLLDLASVFTAVAAPVVLEAQDATGVTVMAADVFEEGLSETGKKPTGHRRTIRYYVLDRGKPTEAAFYMQTEPRNQVDSDVSAKDSSLLSTFRIYSSSVLRQKVQAAMVKAAFNILNEDAMAVDHVKRMNWAAGVFAGEPVVLNIMMAFVSQNAAVQLAGGLATDNDIEWIVNSNIAYTFELSVGGTKCH